MVSMSKPHNAGIFSVMKVASVSTTGPSVRRNALLFKERDLPDGMWPTQLRAIYSLCLLVEMWILSINSLTTHANNIWLIIWACWAWSTWYISVVLPMPAYPRKALRDVGMTTNRYFQLVLPPGSIAAHSAWCPNPVEWWPKIRRKEELRYRIEGQRKS